MKTINVSVRMDIGTYKRLKALAESENRSIAKQVLTLVQDKVGRNSDETPQETAVAGDVAKRPDATPAQKVQEPSLFFGNSDRH